MSVRMRRNYKNHRVTWDAENNTVTIKPQNPNGSKTIRFGLGNAIITINTDSPPEDIIMPITGETSKAGLLPTSPYKWRKWRAAPKGMLTKTKLLTGYRGYSHTITYQEAVDFKAEQVVSSAFVQNGYGVKNVGRGRIEW